MDTKGLAARIDEIDARGAAHGRALDLADHRDGDEVRELRDTIRWAHQTRLARQARAQDWRRTAWAFAGSVLATLVGALIVAAVKWGK